MKNAKFAGVQRLLSAVFAATVALTSVQIPVYATPANWSILPVTAKLLSPVPRVAMVRNV